MGRIILCADSAALCHPQMLGLADESLENIAWLKIFSSAQSARRYMKDAADIAEAWIVSSDDVEAINLAAALRADHQRLRISLVVSDPTDTMLKRIAAAGIGGVLSPQEFVCAFAREKGIRRTSTSEKRLELALSDGRSAHGAENKGNGNSGWQERRLRDTGILQAAADSEYGRIGHNGKQQRGTFLFTVVSGSGGTGKSAVAVLAAYLSCRRGLRTLLLDADFQFGDLAVVMGKNNTLTADRLLACPLDAQKLDRGLGTPALLAAPQRLEQADLVSCDYIDLVDKVSGDYDVVIADTGANWSECHMALLERSTGVFFLVDQRASSIRTCRHALELCARCGIATSSFVCILNRCSSQASLSSVDVSCALQGMHVCEFKDGGFEVEELLGAGMLDELLASKNDFVLSIDRFLTDILPAASLSECSEDGGSSVKISGGSRKAFPFLKRSDAQRKTKHSHPRKERASMRRQDTRGKQAKER